KTHNGNRSVVLIDDESGNETILIPASKENIGHPVLSGNYLFYNSPVSGIDNIYVFELQQQKKLQVTNSKYGCYNVALSADGKTMYYHEQTKNGFDVVTIPVDPATWKEFTEKEVIEGYVHHLAEQEGRSTLFDSIPQQNFATKKYSKLSGIINPYSWGAYFNSTFTQADIGLSSQDILSTTSLSAGYRFDIYERTGAWHAGLSYQNWYPIIDVDFKYANRTSNEGDITYDKVVGTDTTENVTENLTLDWKETTIEAGLRLPLLTTNSKYHGNFTVSNYVGYTHVTDFTNSIDGGGRLIPSNYPQYFLRDYLDNGTLLYNRFSLSAYRLLKQSRRDIYSKFGQAAYLTIYGTPYGGDFFGKQFSFYTTLYFPGFFKHHSIWGYWAYQSSYLPVPRLSGEGLDNYVFNNQIPLPRGLSVSRFEKFHSMSLNYTLPIWYADLAMGPFLNIQRLKGNGFIDYGFGTSPTYANSQSYVSVGGELKLDINVLRYLPQFEIGVRYSYGLEPSVTKVEFLVGLINF
ncbi:MAG TPA: hypothetical protein VFU05_15270, partial [Cyclobacteriaceae bacterium]|nr:hypothetical protein [Cyclobacteriaceae bacterium]